MKHKQRSDFEALKWLSGTIYTKKRDEWLASTPGVRNFLEQEKHSRDWRTSITAQILLGWLDHRSAYEAFSREIEQKDWTRIRKSILGSHEVWQDYGSRAAGIPEYGEMMLPLCWEVVLKQPLRLISNSPSEWLAAAKARTLRTMLQYRHDPRSIEPLFWYMQNVDPGVAEVTLRFFPADPLKRRINRLLVDQQATFQALEDHLDPVVLPSRSNGVQPRVQEEDAILTPTVAPDPEGETAANQSFDFEALKWITGPLYTKKRDEWLASTRDARLILLRHQQDKDWRTSITATILLGWLEHRSEYEALVRELDQVEWEKIEQKPGWKSVWETYAKRVRDNPQLGEMLLHLCWEVVLKRHGEWRHGTTVAFFEMLRERPDERSIEPLFWYLQNVARDQTERDLAARALARTPVEPLKRRVARLRIDQWAVLWAVRRMDAQHIPGGDSVHFFDRFPGP